MYYTHLIYYDENIDFESENYTYVLAFRKKIKGAFFPVKNIDTLKNLVNKMQSCDLKNSFTLVTSGRAAEKVIPICSPIVTNIIIFCFYVEKYVPLKSKFPKIKTVLNDFSEIFTNLNSNKSVLKDGLLIGSKFINFRDYKDNYISFHKTLAYFFDKNYKKLEYKSSYRDIFIDFINNSDVKVKSEAIRLINDAKDGSVQHFIEAYTGESELCYKLNRWLREVNENVYEKIKYFAGPFSYCLYQYAFEKRNQGIYSSKNFFRQMTLKLSDYLLYKICIGELVCYPAFTSTSEELLDKYSFPTQYAINVNELSPNDVSLLLKIKYNCQNNSYTTPCINATEYSINVGEREFIFPPFSFFRIDSIVENSGTPDDPHIINMSVPNKKELLEFGLKDGKTVNYNKSENLLYCS